ncbi:hypothetical protein BC629DRAFT_1440721 [Irpex lacteus]|nr:hypothetical protein BC629DRAFT_1440721 [Irpex lacteus]
MFTSACTNNSNAGQEGPRAGMGCTAGTKEGLTWSESVSGRAAKHSSWIKRLSQRAEVLAAIEGVARVRDVKNNWHDSSGKEPPNLDLFMRLHAMVDDQERELSIKIGFWLVERRFNLVAEGLAREGARRAEPVSC